MITAQALTQVGLTSIVATNLPAHAWPGGYPLFYLDLDNHGAVCASCATRIAQDDPHAAIVACDINWEDDTLYCDECNSKIPCAYQD